MIIKLRFIKSSAETETVEVIGIIEVIMMILTSEKWLFKAVAVLSLIDAALTAAMIWD